MKNKVKETLKNWANFIVLKDSQKLLELYDENAFLKPTLSHQIRKTKKEILSYFIGGGELNDSGFLNQEITQVEFLESNITILNGMALAMGLYQFTRKKNSVLRAHYTFVFKNQGDHLKIIAHHSSLEVK